MAITSDRPTHIGAFPEEALKASISEWWDTTVGIKEDDPFAVRPNTLYDLVVDIDSLSAVEALVVIEREIGFEPPVSVIRRGGYKSCDDMIEHVLPALRRHFETRKNITPSTPRHAR